MAGTVVILGVFVADTTYRMERFPKMGETVLANSFVLGPGGKGSNQVVAAGRAGAATTILTKLGRDTFARIADDTWEAAGVDTGAVIRDGDGSTGAACILVDDGAGDNAIAIAPGLAGTITATDIDTWGDRIDAASVFLTQLEQPVEAAFRGLQRARAAGVATILNPAPAAELTDAMLALCDYVTPNESEAEALTGAPVGNVEEARTAAEALIARGVGAAVITLGAAGALYHDGTTSEHVPAIAVDRVVETTGAGDAFNGGFAAALAGGADPVLAVRFGMATAGLSVGRAGAAASMPWGDEIRAHLSET